MKQTHPLSWKIAAVGALGLSLWLCGGTVPLPTPASPETAAPPPLRPPTTCPTNLETLTTGLLRDLPSYANRVATRSLGNYDAETEFGTMLIAGRAEFAPLDIDALTFGDESTITAADVQQVFFTTLERQYTATDFINLEQYHWLFLAPDEDGWQLVLLFSRTAPAAATVRPPSPPRENSDGIIGQAVRLWLRDCRAGAIKPIEAEAADEIGR